MIAAALLASVLAAQPACEARITPQLTRELYDRIVASSADGGCTFEGLSADRDVFEVRFADAGSAHIAKDGCATGAPGRWTMTASDELRAGCPGVLPGLASAVESLEPSRRDALRRGFSLARQRASTAAFVLGWLFVAGLAAVQLARSRVDERADD